MKCVYTLLFFCSLNILAANAQKQIHRDSLLADFRYLVEQLEFTHPDPYSGFGGRPFFHQAVQETLQELQQTDPLTLKAFAEKSNAFLSRLQDGHTYLSFPRSTSQGGNRYAPIWFKTINDGIIVSSVTDTRPGLIGSRMERINGIDLEELAQRAATAFSCENEYGRYSTLAWRSNSENFLRQLHTDFTDSLHYTLRTPQGESIEVPLPLIAVDSLQRIARTRASRWERYPQEYLAYTFADEEKKVMLFRSASIMARENFTYTLQRKWDNAYGQIQEFYRYTLKREMPADTTQALKSIPSFSETFAEMLDEMKRHRSTHLIIDLRGNGGGWTPITRPTLLMLYGDRYLTTDMDSRFYRRLSPLYFQKINSTLKAFNKQNNAHFRMGDYLFDADEKETETTTPSDTLRKRFIADCMSDTRPLLTRLKGKPLYQPARIYVLTDADTFSAAFHYAFYLWKMGATVVGVPSSQAPNTYMEQTPFTLPRCGLQGSISNSLQLFLPPQDPRAKTFYPDLMPDYEENRKRGFDTHTEILYLLDKIKSLEE